MGITVVHHSAGRSLLGSRIEIIDPEGFYGFMGMTGIIMSANHDILGIGDQNRSPNLSKSPDNSNAAGKAIG